jgi:hypothetical protein
MIYITQAILVITLEKLLIIFPLLVATHFLCVVALAAEIVRCIENTGHSLLRDFLTFLAMYMLALYTWPDLLHAINFQALLFSSLYY